MNVKKSIECWVMNPSKNKVLLLKVPPKKGHQAFFQPITGGIESNEAPEEACLREVLEETGLRLSSNDLVKITKNFAVKIDQNLQINKTIYAVNTDYFQPKLNPSEHISFAWVNTEDVIPSLTYQSNIDTWLLTQTKVLQTA